MTDMVKEFNVAAQSLESGMAGTVRGYRNAAAKVDIMKEFRLRQVFLDVVNNENNKF